MHWSEEVLALDEIKQIYEQLYGWTKKGGDRKSEQWKNQILTVSNRFSQPKLAEELNISQQKVSMDLQLAKALKEYPDLAKLDSKKAASI